MKISIRYQVLLVIVGALGSAMATYLVLATRWFAEDRIAYTYDLAATSADAKAEEIAVVLQTYAVRGRYLMRATAQSGSGQLGELLRDELSTAAVEVWRREGSRPTLVHDFVNHAALRAIGLSAQDLQAIRASGTLPIQAIPQGDVRAFNVSMPPDLPMLAIATDVPGGVVVFFVHPDALLRLIPNRQRQTQYAVGQNGRVVLHTDRALMISRANLASLGVVQEALASKARQGVSEFKKGSDVMLGAYSHAALGGLVIVSEVPKLVATQATRVLVERSVMFGVAILFAVLGLGVWVSRRIVKPLIALERTAVKIGEGDFNVDIAPGSGREVASLALAFKKMAQELAFREHRLKDAYAQLQQQDRMVLVGTLAAGVAHEINNPLTYVVANHLVVMEFLRDAIKYIAAQDSQDSAAIALVERSEDMLDAAKDIGDGAERVRIIVRDLKMFSRSESDKEELVDVRATLDSALKMAAHEIRSRAQIVKNYGEVPMVQANDARLGQVFLNLLVNAAQAIPAGHLEKNEIRISTHADAEGRAVVTIGDTGPGMSEEVANKIFDPFFTTKPIGAGTGLGLSICQSIVSGFDGEIRVETQLSQGSVFSITLPAAAAETIAEVTEEASAERPHIRPLRLLAIDDEQGIGILFERLLGTQHTVEIASSGAAGIEALGNAEGFDVVFCDLIMPKTTGMEVYAWACEHAKELREKFVFMTGGAFTPEARIFIEGTDRQVIDKPFDVDILETILTGAANAS